MQLRIKQQYASLFGYGVESLKHLSKPLFKSFLDLKRSYEREVLEKIPVIITTIGKACSTQFRATKFKKVIIDEATMAKEHEAFLNIISAEQVVLVGD
mmetsp:Transcript_25448/g.31818  ORF Transcript_25448/g.31818 Transcript_25448/m.31818 type:complete len:98 (-) Transcript_25448:52-345(-)